MRVCGPERPGDRGIWPGALHLRVEADPAAGTGSHLWPGSQFGCAARASRACQGNAQQSPNNRSKEPEIEQKCPEHPKTFKHAQGMFGIKANQHRRQDKHQEPSEAPCNVQLPLEMFPDTHVANRTWVDSRTLPVPCWRRHILATCRYLVAKVRSRFICSRPKPAVDSGRTSTLARCTLSTYEDIQSWPFAVAVCAAASRLRSTELTDPPSSATAIVVARCPEPRLF
jgi:hypothetical protein